MRQSPLKELSPTYLEEHNANYMVDSQVASAEVSRLFGKIGIVSHSGPSNGIFNTENKRSPASKGQSDNKIEPAFDSFV